MRDQEKRRHLIIPDTQVKPGEDQEHLKWAGRAIADLRPDVIVHLGDHWDMGSLSSYDKPGSLHREGARYVDDIRAGNEGMEILVAPWRNIKGYLPECVFLTGNHEHRIERAIEDDPVRLEGVIGYDDFELCGFRRYEFLEVVFIDGIAYSHYFQNINSRYAIGGSVDNRLNKIGCTFVQGHEQGFKYGNRVMPTGKIHHGIVAGSYYRHDESYKGRQGNCHWRGIVVLNEVRDGTFDIMPLSIEYMQERYGKER